MAYKSVKRALNEGKFTPSFETLYGSKAGKHNAQAARYARVIDGFAEYYGTDKQIRIFSTPGRTEVGGNHTDHNGGMVLASSVDLDMVAVAAPAEGYVKLRSDGYNEILIPLNENAYDPRESDRFNSVALIRGVFRGFKDNGFKLGGFNAYMHSSVLKGSGLSSSAAFEVLIATILNGLYNDHKVHPVLMARIAQFAENKFFGKPCGLMDQTACSVGALVKIDFKNDAQPLVDKIIFNFEKAGYSLFVTDTGGSHSELNAEYGAIKNEMVSVANALGGKKLGVLSREKLIKSIPKLRGKVKDRAILRALHFFDDNERVALQADALAKNDINEFLRLITESGQSSWTLLQNCYTGQGEQGISLGLAASAEILRGKGAWRVHGGGFAGTIQAFVPEELCVRYKEYMESIFGAGTCHELYLRPVGSVELMVQ